MKRCGTVEWPSSGTSWRWDDKRSAQRILRLRGRSMATVNCMRLGIPRVIGVGWIAGRYLVAGAAVSWVIAVLIGLFWTQHTKVYAASDFVGQPLVMQSDLVMDRCWRSNGMANPKVREYDIHPARPVPKPIRSAIREETRRIIATGFPWRCFVSTIELDSTRVFDPTSSGEGVFSWGEWAGLREVSADPQVLGLLRSQNHANVFSLINIFNGGVRTRLDVVEAPMELRGLPIPLNIDTGGKIYEVIPYIPWWPGLLGDAAVWGLAMWLMVRCMILGRGMVRRWRRRCGRCGYDLRGGAAGSACSECGSAG